ncbi:MAG: GNAT family N-acetyltransferase [Rhizobiaceae bacterium]|nr:GNAT family N-acetyltransferase [Rhizobiaceae bacterium]
MALMIEVSHVSSDLPEGLSSLAMEARREGYRFVDRLVDEWVDGRNRFDRNGERLMMANIDGSLVAIGGLTIEPAMTEALRMRRFYVHPSYRGQGIGGLLARELLEHARHATNQVTVNAGTVGAAAFWQKLGFQLCERDGYSHILRLAE